MKSKTISEALEEIWEIKERIYQEDKDCSMLESLKRAHKITEQILKERKMSRCAGVRVNELAGGRVIGKGKSRKHQKQWRVMSG